MNTYRVEFLFLPSQSPKIKEVQASSANKAVSKALRALLRDIHQPATSKHLFKFHSCKKLDDPETLRMAF